MTTALSVTHLVNSVKNLLEGEFAQVSVIGEVSNLTRSSAGHIYFTLSDVESGLSAVLFRADALRNPATRTLKNGDKIVCHGGLSVYGKRGTFQLLVRRFEAAGAGDLQLQFEKLKRELAAQGLFDVDQKKAIPEFAKRIAVITASGAAALQDFINVYKRRALSGEVVVVPALVQGVQSAASLRHALARAIKYGLSDPSKSFDVIVFTRGGGSMEDLWSFNDEALAWDIYNCPIPVISAVGHQVDFTICDFVADMRCETPTAAAEQLTQTQTQVRTRLERIKSELLHSATSMRTSYQRRLDQLSPINQSHILKDRLARLSRRLRECYLEDKIEKVTAYTQKSLRLDDVSRRLEFEMTSLVASLGKRLEHDVKMLEVLDPKSVLGRGYTYVTDESDRVIPSKLDWDKTDEVSVRKLHFKDGHVKIVKGNN